MTTLEYAAVVLVALLAAVVAYRLGTRHRRVPTAAAEEVKERERVLFDESHTPVLVIDRRGDYVDANEAALAFLEITRGELIGKSVCDFAAPDTPYQGLLDEHREYWKGGGQVETAYLVHGRRKYLDLTIVPSARGTDNVFGIGRDITAEKVAGERLVENEKFLNAIVNDVPELICRWRPDGFIFYANQAYSDYFGKDREALIGSSIFANVPVDDRETINQHVGILTPEQPVVRYEHRVVDRDGQVRWQRWVDRGLFDGERLTEIQSTGSDVTEEVSHSRELERLTRVLQTLSRCNSALVHARDEKHLLSEICRHVVTTGGYRMAWVGFAADTPDHPLQPVTSFGEGTDFVTSVKCREGEEQASTCPTCMAIITGETSIVQQLTSHTAEYPWAGEALKRGFHSMAVIPLVQEDRVFGALSIFSADPEAFQPAEIKLLLELSQDMAYGIQALRDATERRVLEMNRQEQALRLQETLVETIEAMTLAVEKRDPYTAGHQQRVSQLASSIAREMGLSDDQVEGIRLGALVHDIGKIAVPSEILTRPGRLTNLEFSLIKPHPDIGHEIMAGIRFSWPVADMIWEHHERLDGSGYPKGLKNGAIRLESRILAVADTVEAASNHRPYRPGKPLDSILDEIEAEKGAQFDPAVVDACLKLFREKHFQWH